MHENLDRPQRRPNHEVFAVLPSREATEAVSAGVTGLGIDPDEVEVLYGDAGIAVFDATGETHGLRARFVRALKNLGGVDAEGIASYREALTAGRYVVSVGLPDGHSRRSVLDVLERHGAQDLRFFGTGSMETVPDDYPE